MGWGCVEIENLALGSATVANKQYSRNYFIYCGYIIITPAQRAAPKSTKYKNCEREKYANGRAMAAIVVIVSAIGRQRDRRTDGQTDTLTVRPS